MDSNRQTLKSELVSLLYRGGDYISAERICEYFGVDAKVLREVVEELRQSLNPLGLEIVFSAGGYRLTTHPRVFHTIRSFFAELRETTLSHQALEVLAIIAYKQPITRAEIEEIRQVSSESVIKSLLAKRLIRVKGRAMAPGRPFLYVSTNHFLETFGLASLDELPRLEFRELEERFTDIPK